MLFSIVVPVYNVAPYLGACLDSLLAQTVRDWECICVDDGSTDASGAILDEYSGKDGRIRVIHQANAGVSVARNVALGQVTGDYVCFVDADDVVEVSWLCDYAKAIDRCQCDVVRQRSLAGRTVEAVYSAGSEMYSWWWKECIADGYPWMYCIRRAIACRASFPEGVAMGEDELYLLRAMRYVKSACQIASRGYLHRTVQGSAMFKKLRSRERVAYLKTLEQAVATAPAVAENIFTSMIVDAVGAWLTRPLDVVASKEVRTLLVRLQGLPWFRWNGVRLRSMVPLYVFMRCGWCWPARLSAGIVNILVQVKHLIGKAQT